MKETEVRMAFDRCVLTDEEMKGEVPGCVWPLIADPWNEWSDPEDDSDEGA
jgi:hypothetical protein